MSFNKIAIVIISHGQLSLVNSLLETFFSYDPDLDYGIYVLENTNMDLGVLDAKFKDKVELFQNSQPIGLAENLNKIFTRINSEYFCVVNPDVQFIEEVFSGLIKSIETKNVDIIAPLVLNGGGEIEDSFRSIPKPIEILKRGIFGKPKIISINVDSQGMVYPEWIAGMFLLMRSSVMRDLDGFNSKFHLYFEDVEFCLRAQLKNYKLAVDTNYKIIHNARRESHFRPLYFSYHIRSAFQFFLSSHYFYFLKKKSR